MTIKNYRRKVLEMQEVTAANWACLAGCDYLHAIDNYKFVQEYGDLVNDYQ